MLIIGHDEVAGVLAGREQELTDLVRDAYCLHDEDLTVVPRSVFLRFPDQPANRMIGLPAYLGGRHAAAGMKWISSFPGNTAHGLERASAAIILNSLTTGQPEALIEASAISAKRTAASAALAAGLLAGRPEAITLIGCGVINFEVLRFAAATLPSIRRVWLHDTDPGRAAALARRIALSVPDLAVTIETDPATALAAHSLVSIATTAAQPHLDLTACRPGSTILHVSLRDLTPQAILAHRNVVDDPDHVCRERTSLDLAEQLSGGRAFIDASIGALLRGRQSLRRGPGETVIFSPFGLGILDIALASLVRDEVSQQGGGVRVANFLPAAPVFAAAGPRPD